jgi:hypothetical protein
VASQLSTAVVAAHIGRLHAEAFGNQDGTGPGVMVLSVIPEAELPALVQPGR